MFAPVRKLLPHGLATAALVACFTADTAAQSLKAAPMTQDLIDLLEDPMAVPGERIPFPGLTPIPELAVHSLYDNIFTNQPLLVDEEGLINYDIPATGTSPFINGVPERALSVPLNQFDFIDDNAAAIQLGKALFWDMQVGSDGVQACGSCHFHAGADNRIQNQINPGTFASDQNLEVAGPNALLKVTDFPTHKLKNINIPGEPLLNPANVERDSNDVISSMGVRYREFVDIWTPGASAFIPGTTPPVLKPDIGLAAADPEGAVFQGLRRVEPRNTPTIFGAANNFNNFWDGRARQDFNGGSPHGASDPYPHIFEDNGGGLEATRQMIRFSSTASLSTGPALSNFEMSFNGRDWHKIGKKLLQDGVTPLAMQLVDPTDSVLGPLSNQNHTPGMPGLTISYAELIELAFADRLWTNSTEHLTPIADAADPFDGTSLVLAAGPASATNTSEYTQAEANFSLFFGLAVQAFVEILLPNDSAFDQFHDANPEEFLGLVNDIDPIKPGPQVDGLTERQLHGYDIFQGTNLSLMNPLGKTAQCNICHFGPETTEHSITGIHDIFPPHAITGEDMQVPGFLLEELIAGNATNVMEMDGLNPALDGNAAPDGHGLVDKGVYNIGVRPLSEDISRGADDAFGFPLSLAALTLNHMGYPINEFSDPNNPIPPLPDHLAPYVNEIIKGAEFPNIAKDVFLPDTISPTVNVPVPPFGTFPVPNRVASMGNFKVPGLKNVELTGPYFHNGGQATLRQIVDFYSRGGDFPETNADHRDPLIRDLNVNFDAQLDEADKVALVDFLLAMTDERVRYEQAPFDHPEIIIPIDGSAPDNTGGRAQLLSDTRFLRINAIGAAGRDQPLKSFLGISAIEGDPGPDHFDSVITTEPMSLHGFFPGVAATANKMTITGAVPGAPLGIVASTNLGSATINLACGSIDLGLLPPYRISGLVPADAFGNVSFTFAIPASLRGMTFHFQAVQPGTCLVSDISTTTF